MNIRDLLDGYKSTTGTKESTSFMNMIDYSRNMVLNTIGNTIAASIQLDMHKGPWIAGGSVRKCFLNQSIGHSDWDIFFNNQKQFDDARNILSGITECYPIFESKNAITFQIHDYSDPANVIYGTPIKIQIICRKFYNTWEDVISDFDFTICQFITDGRIIKLGNSTYLDNVDNVLKLTSPDMCIRPGFMSRVIKYITYGYKPSSELLELIDTKFNQIDFSTKVNEYDF